MAFGTAETAKLIVDLSLHGNFLSQLGKVNGALAKTAANLDRTQSRAYRAGQQIGTGIKRGAVIAAAGVGFLASQVAFGVNSLVKLESATTQTAAVIRSTKGAAGQTAASIRSLAEGFESLNAQMDDTVIQSGANVLLTFTNIRQKAFKPALQAALDLSTAMHQDLQTSVVQLGKALNDPIKGLTSLQRIGVSFDPVQKKQIAGFFQLTKEEQKHYTALLKTNKAAAANFLETKRQNAITKAQGIILAEINKEFGGSFAAGGKTIAGQFASIGDAVEDLQRTLATALLPTISKVALAIESMLRDPTVVKGIADFGQSLADTFSSGQIIDGIKSITDSFGTLVDLVKVAAAPVKAIVQAFLSLPKEVQGVLVGAFAVNKLTGGLVTNVFGGIAEAIAKSFIRAPLVNVQGGVVNVAGGPGGIPGTGGGGKGISVLGGLTAAAIGLAIASAWKSTFQDPELQKQTDSIDKSVKAQIDQKHSLAELLTTQAALQQGISDLTVQDKNGNPVPILNDIFGVLYGGQKQDLQNQLTLIQAAIAAAIAAGPSTTIATGGGRLPGGTGALGGTAKTKGRTSFTNQEQGRGAKADALAAAEARAASKAAAKAAAAANAAEKDIMAIRAAGSPFGGKNGAGTFVATAVLDPSQVRDLRTTADATNKTTVDIETLRGKIATGLSDTAASSERAGEVVAGAIRSKDLSISQAIEIKVNVSAAGVTKSVTIQNRAGPGNGSAGDDFRGGKPAGGL